MRDDILVQTCAREAVTIGHARVIAVRANVTMALQPWKNYYP